MPSIIEQLWIFSRDGVPLADFCRTESLNKALFGPFISAMQTFCKEVSGGLLSSFELVNKKFTCTSSLEDNIILVCKSPSSVKDKKIQKFFKVITQMFEDMYSKDDLLNWNGDLSFFDKFGNKLELYFKMAEL